MENILEDTNPYDKLIDFELAKRNHNSKIKKYFPVSIFLVSSYYSFLLGLGLFAGYVGSKIFCKYFIERERVDCIYIDFGSWKFHLHHWILGAVILLLVGIIDYFYLPRFFTGVVLGVIIHDIYDFNDWRRVLIKKEEN